MPKDNKPKLRCSKDHLSSGTHLKSIRQVPRTLQTTAWNHAKIMDLFLETPAPPLQIPVFFWQTWLRGFPGSKPFCQARWWCQPYPTQRIRGWASTKQKMTTLSPTTTEVEKLGPPNERKLLLEGTIFHFHYYVRTCHSPWPEKEFRSKNTCMLANLRRFA